MDENNLIIKLNGISFAYSGGRTILDDLSLEVSRGCKMGLMGPNGSGKTTLFHIIMGLLKPLSGTIEIFGKPVKDEKNFMDVRRRVGLLFQDADDQLFSPTVLDDVAFGPLNLGKSPEEAKTIASATLERLGLGGFEDRITHKLSGGEKRLVSFATVLAMEPELLLLDEPMNGLDEQTKETLMGVLSALELTYIVISHELEFLDETTDSIYTMEEGKIRLDKALHIHRHEHAHPYGRYPHKH